MKKPPTQLELLTQQLKHARCVAKNHTEKYATQTKAKCITDPDTNETVAIGYTILNKDGDPVTISNLAGYFAMN